MVRPHHFTAIPQTTKKVPLNKKGLENNFGTNRHDAMDAEP
jgi:hypothetical protein